MIPSLQGWLILFVTDKDPCPLCTWMATLQGVSPVVEVASGGTAPPRAEVDPPLSRLGLTVLPLLPPLRLRSTPPAHVVGARRADNLEVVVEAEGEEVPLPPLEGAEEGPVPDGLPLPLGPLCGPLAALPVGARLRHFADQWKNVTHDPWVLQVVRNGLSLLFLEMPPMSSKPLPFRLPLDVEKATLLRHEVHEMLVKQAIVPVKNTFTPGFYSLIFLVPKKNGQLRPVFDLSSLNTYLDVAKFKMTTPQSVRSALSQGDWAVSLDLKDAYFHIPIHAGSWKYLRFAMDGQTYQFVALPFGIASAPQVFTRVFSAIGAFLHRHNINIVMYIDDWLIYHKDPGQLSVIVQEILPLLSQLGIVINLAKSDLTPRQRFHYIGVEFWTDKALVMPPMDRIVKLHALLDRLLNRTQCVARELLSLIGMCNSMMALVPLGRLHLRPLQWFLRDRYIPKTDPVTKVIPLVRHELEVLTRPWRDTAWLRQGAQMHPLAPQLTLVTDASRHGWGGYLGSQEVSGVWDELHQSYHINVLELKAILFCLQKLEKSVRKQVVLVLSDNVTAVHYINKQGGTHSRLLNNTAVELLMWCQERAISLSARHILGSLNVLADQLSRIQIDPKEWTLSAKVTAEIFRLWGTPQVDLFANRWTHRLPSFCSPCPDQDAWQVDALSIDWTGLVGYAYPPGVLVPKILEKMEVQPCELLLVAPLWPSRNWYPSLLALSTEPPRMLPLWRTLLRQPRKGVYASLVSLGRYNLHVWRLSSRPSARKGLLHALPEPLPQLTGLLPSGCTTPDGRSTLVGVRRGVWIQSTPLFP